MKKPLILFVFLCLCTGVFLYLKRNTQSLPQQAIVANETNGNQLQPAENHTPISNSAPVLAEAENTNEIMNGLAATNLEQWKSLISGLKYSDNFGRWNSWIMEQTNHLIGVPIVFEENGKTVSYKVQFINVGVYNDNSGKLMEVQMHSPSMNIDETRELGLQFCDMLQIDSKGFLEWCDKVGNHWLDAPLYSTETSAHLSFFILRTYNNERPWSIDFQINNP